MRQRIVAGNWKMNASSKSINDLITGIVNGLNSNQTKVIVCPPFPYLSQVQKATQNSEISIGAQNVNLNQAGAFTGEVSTSMLKDFAVSSVIVGHSERRSLYGETNEIVAQKTKVVLDAGLTPIVCFGELLEEREDGITEKIIKSQLDAVIEEVGIEAFKNIIIAYEPVWAIGTGKVATPEQAQAVHAFIRNELASKNNNIAQNCAILYGGSVNGKNAQELFACDDIDGGLVGGASLEVDSFLQICHA
ncbi:Triosephosphate isomerase [hydrothermal vent metagenome]|uniref:triose-phosphate isomerase n=1 Tax=hydrothermal vent metagenome TaxID=652676 RepID=A0A1W1CWP2_9ZZZZ